MRLFIIGKTGDGKTTLGKALAGECNIPHIEASEWVKARFGRSVDSFPSREEYVAAITAFSIAELAKKPAACVEYLAMHHDLDRPCVISGIRNPRDFMHLFRSEKDIAICLTRPGGEPGTVFEEGVEIIGTYLAYLAKTRLIGGQRFKQVFTISYKPCDRTRIATMEEVLPSIAEAVASDSRTNQDIHSFVHADLPLPLDLMVGEEFFYDMDPDHEGEFVPARAFALACYKGSVPTFTVRTFDGSVFSYLPPDAVGSPEVPHCGDLVLSRKELVYHDCPSEKFVLICHRELKGGVNAFFKERRIWLTGQYLFTVDWYEGNDLLHCIHLENGQFAFLPHHKVKFKDGTRDFKQFKKMRSTWSVGTSDPGI
ncbi:MAG: hypothetical protein V4674_03865 [Patescibacteria group bacterium]